MLVREVFVAQNRGEPALCVIEKRLTSRERDVAAARARLHHEGDLLAALAGGPTPGLVGRGTDAEGPYLHIAKIDAPTLADRPSPLDAAWLARATRAAFQALAALHEARDARGPLAIVHADLSPANVIVDDDGTRAWLLDLELSCSRDGVRERDGAFRGTARYCAPEVAREETPTVQSDLFALAATLAHATLGVPPRDASSLPALLLVAAEQPLPARVTRALPAAVAACLAHDPIDRPPSARAVLAALC